jgi:hypothetical protein
MISSGILDSKVAVLIEIRRLRVKILLIDALIQVLHSFLWKQTKK